MSAASIIYDFHINGNVLAGRNPPCTGKSRCLGDDQFTWFWCSFSNLEPEILQEICCTLLEYASNRSDVVLPDGDNTVVSCKGNVHAITWKPFCMNVFNDPAPRSSIDATLASCLLCLRCSTENRSERLSYGKHMLESKMVLSRSDILRLYRTLAGQSKENMCDGIRSIKLQHFLQERDQFEDDSD
jgi:hypothetical protein